MSVAEALLDAHAVRFYPSQPVRFKSGLLSPVYVDNRVLPFHPASWHVVIDGLASMVREKNIRFDVLAGVESAGIPHSAALGYTLSTPSVFVRKQPKEHGTKKRVEGGDVTAKTVLLLEDVVSTGGSSLNAVRALRDEGAKITDCVCIVSHGFDEMWAAFAEAEVTLHILAPFSALLRAAQARGAFDAAAMGVIEDWLADPHDWASRHNHA